MSTETTLKTSSSIFTFTVSDMVLCGMFAALLSVLSQLSIPMPTGVPITIQIFAVALTGAVLGSRLGFVAALVFILIGAVGLPVFSNFRGGIQILTGVTGGYLWSYPFMAALCGFSPKTPSKTTGLLFHFFFALLGLALAETAGGLQWAALAGDKSFSAIMAYAFIAFIPKDFILTVTAVLIGRQMRTSFRKAGYTF